MPKRSLDIVAGCLSSEFGDQRNIRNGRRVIKTQWMIPLWTNSEYMRIVEILASDVMLFGRWISCSANENDRQQLGVKESDWQSLCSCNENNICRHAYSMLYDFRNLAMEDPWIWMEIRGFHRQKMQADIRFTRHTLTKKKEEQIAIQLQYIKNKIENHLRKDHNMENKDLSLLEMMPDPAFWNREIPFKDWVLPIYKAVQKGEHAHSCRTD